MQKHARSKGTARDRRCPYYVRASAPRMRRYYLVLTFPNYEIIRHFKDAAYAIRK